MTKQETPETVHPDVSTFNIQEWLTTGETSRVKESVTIYKEPSLLDEARRLVSDINALNAEDTGEPDPDAALGDEDEASELQRRHDMLEEQIKATKAEVAVFALSDEEIEDIGATFKQRYPGEKRQWDQTVKGTCLVLAKAATVNGQKLSADQWRGLANGPLAGGQWQRLKQTHLLAQNKTPRVDTPFLQRG